LVRLDLPGFEVRARGSRGIAEPVATGAIGALDERASFVRGLGAPGSTSCGPCPEIAEEEAAGGPYAPDRSGVLDGLPDMPGGTSGLFLVSGAEIASEYRAKPSVGTPAGSPTR
jgi:hypothetical protein